MIIMRHQSNESSIKRLGEKGVSLEIDVMWELCYVN